MSTARTYELIYILPPETTDEAVADLQKLVADIIEKGGGAIESTENWGRRKLAYEIERFREGIYVLHVVTGPGDLVTELERRLRVMDIVMRHLVIRVDEELAVAGRAGARRKAAVAARRERRGLPPEPEAPAATGSDESAEGDDEDGARMGGDL